MATISRIFGVEGYTDPATQLFGIECEVESVNVNESWDFLSSKAIRITEDNSLRNNGKEFLIGPASAANALVSFNYLHTNGKWVNPADKFSHRTSIHVHANCQNREGPVVRTAVLLYALFEEYFFSMVDSSRRDNIHCVPLTDTYLPSIYGADIVGLCGRWHKYTALNIKPLGTLGTIEFRHMQGHDDLTLLRQWLTVIDNLLTLADTVGTIKKEHMVWNVVEEWFDRLFRDVPQVYSKKDQLRQTCRNQFIDLKLSFM
jgi:hypothetical protein